jgi:hypothetical protein
MDASYSSVAWRSLFQGFELTVSAQDSFNRLSSSHDGISIAAASTGKNEAGMPLSTEPSSGWMENVETPE